MNKDQIKGKAKVMAGNVEEQAGYWTDDKKVEAKGIVLQVEGKTQKAWGDMKDALDKASERITAQKESAPARIKKSNRKTA